MDERYQQSVMQMIMFGGNAKSLSIEAINAAKAKNFQLADQKLQEAETSIAHAHQQQTTMLTNDANVITEGKGEMTPVTLYLVHAQDHIMNAITFRDLAVEIVDLYKRLAEK